MQFMDPNGFPFLHENDNPPWSLWEAHNSVFSLPEPTLSENMSAYEEPWKPPMEKLRNQEQVLTPLTIQRPQYNAILDRMNFAKRKSGPYSSWTT